MKKFFSYILTFLVVFVLTSATVVSLSSSGGTGNLNQSIGDQSNASSVFSSLLASFQDNPQFNIKGNLAVNYDDEEIDIEVYLNADISDSADMKFEGFVSVSNDKTPRYLEFSYVENVIYLSFMNNSLKATGSSLNDLVGFAKGFISSGDGSGDNAIGDLLGEIDTNELMQTLMSAMDNIVETELEDGGKQLEMNIDGLANIKIMMDSDDKPCQAVVSTEKFGDISIEADVYVDFNDYIIVSNPETQHPEKEYIEIGEVLEFVNNTIATKELGLSANVIYGDRNYFANLNLDLESKNFKIDAMNDYAVTYLDGDLFVDASGVRFLVSENLINKFPELSDQLMSLATKEGIAFNKVEEAVQKISTFDPLRLLASIKDISSSRSGITILLDGSAFKLGSPIRIFIGIENKKLSNIVVGTSINGENLEAEIFISDKAEKIEVNEENYLDLENLYNINKDYFNTNQLSIDMALELRGKTELSLRGSLDLDGLNDYYRLDAEVFYNEPINLSLAYYNSTVFARLNNIQAKMTRAKLEEIISSLDVEIDTSELEQKIKEIQESFDINKLVDILKKIEAFEVSPNGLYVRYDGMELRVTLDGDRLALISVESDELSLSLDVKANSVERKAVNENEYIDVFALAENLQNLDLSKGSLSANVSALVDGKNYNANIQFVGSKSQERLSLALQLLGALELNLKADYYDGNAYVVLNDIYIKAAKDQIMSLLNGKLPEVDIEGLLSKLKEASLYKKIMEFAENFEISKLSLFKNIIVNSSKIQLTIDKAVLGSKEDTTIIITLSGNMISRVEISNLELDEKIKVSGSVSLSFDEPTFERVDEKKYLDVLNILDYLKGLEITKGSISASVNAQIKGKNYSADFRLAGDKDQNKATLNFNLHGKKILNVKVVYEGDVAYVTIGDILVKVSKDQIAGLIKELAPEINEDELTQKLKAAEIYTSVKNFLENFDLSSLELIKDIKINNSVVQLTLDKSILGANEDTIVFVRFNGTMISEIEILNFELDDEMKFSVKASLSLETPTMSSVDGSKYLDIVELYENLKNLDLTKGSLSASVDALVKGETYRADFRLAGDKNQNKATLNFNLYGKKTLNVKVVYEGDVAYVTIGNILVKVSKDQIAGLIKEFVPDVDMSQILEKLKEAEIYSRVLEFINNFDISKLEMFKDIRVNASGLQLTIDKSLLGFGEDVTVFVRLNGNMVSGIEILNLGLSKDIKVSFKASVSFETPTMSSVDGSKYLDVVELYENLKNLDLTKGSLSASVDALVKGENYKVDFRLAGNKNQNKATLDLTLYGKRTLNVKINYEGNVAYVTIGNILVKVSKDQIAGLIKELVPEVNEDELVEKLKATEIYTRVYDFITNFQLSSLELIKDIQINNSVIQLTIDKSILGANEDAIVLVKLSGNMVSGIDILNLELSKDLKFSVKASLSFDAPTMSSIEHNKYLDALTLLENVKNLDYTKGSLAANLYAIINGKSYEAKVQFAGNLKDEKLALTLQLLGALELSLKANYYDGNAYVVLNNMFVKASKEGILGLIGNNLPTMDSDELLNKLKDTELYKKIMDFINNFEISKLSLFKDIVINSTTIKVTIDKSVLGSAEDTTLTITLKNEMIESLAISSLELADNIKISGNISVSFEEPTIERVEENKYLDIEKLYDGIINLLRRENVGVSGYVDLALSDGFSGRFNLDIRKKLQGNILLGYMFINLISGEDNLDITTTYLGQTLYIEICGLKVKIDASDIQATVNNIMSVFNIAPEKYSSLIGIIVDRLNGESFDSIIEKRGIGIGGSNINFSNIKLSLEDIVNILKGIEIDSSKIKLTLDGKLLGQEGEISIILNLNNYDITKLIVSGLKFEENSIDVDLDFNYEEQEIETIEEAEKESYINLYGLSEAIGPVYKTLKDGSISGTFLLSFMYGEELNEVEVEYGFKFKDMKLSGYIRATFKGLSINAYFIDNTFYLDVVGLKVYLPIDEIDALKERLGIKDKENIGETTNSIELLLNAKTLNEMIHALAGLNLDFVDHVNFRSGVIDAYFKGNINLFVSYGEKVKSVNLFTEPFDIHLDVQSYDDVVVDSVDQSEFESWTILVDTFDNIKLTLSQKTFNAHAEAHSYKNESIVDNAQVDLALDINNGINASGTITVSGETNLVINYGYQNDTLFAQYENMKLKINKTAIASLLAIACDLVGIDASTLLGDDYSDLNIKSDAIKEFIPDFDAGNPLNMLYLIKAIKIEDGAFVITLDGTRINTKSKKDMTLKLKTDETGVKEVDLLNIYTKEDSNEYFNFILTFNKFTGVTPIEDNGYIDISDSPDLIAGLINTYSKQDFYISGSVTLAIFGLNLSGIVSVDVEGQIKVVDNKLKMALEISSYPITSVAGYGTDANSNGDGLSRRSISIYYDDGYCYLKTYDKEKIIKDALTREVKLPYQDVLNNIEHYLQWLFGFTDKIMEKIHSAIEVSRTQPIDVSNLIKSYGFDGQTHTVAINMEAITHDSNVGALSVSFETENKKLGDDTKEKRYISAIGIDLSLVGILDVKTEPNAPLRVDFNKQADFSKMDEYIKNFNASKSPYKEYRTEGSKESLENSASYSITLDNNNGTADSTLSGAIGDYVAPSKVDGVNNLIVLPKLEPWQHDDGKSIKYYEFDGWYNEDGTAFEGTYLLQNVKLVAHWKQVNERFYYTVTFKNEVDNTSWTKTILEGDSLTLERLTKASHDDYEGERKVHKDYTFNGWLDGEETLLNNSMTMPSKNIVLTASWNIRVRKYFTITFNTVLPKSSKESITALEGDRINLDRLSNHSFEQDGTYYEYAFVDWLNEAGEVVSSIVLDRDMIITAKWTDDPVDTYKQKMLSIYSVDENGTSKLAWSGLQKVGNRFSIEFDSSLNIVDSTRLYRSYSDRTKKYADLFEKSADGRYIMPDENLSLYISNQFVVTFKAEEDKFSFNLTATLYQGDDINFNDILNYSGSDAELNGLKNTMGSNAKVYDTYAVDYYDYKFLGWNLNGESFTASVMPGKDLELVASFDSGYLKYMRVVFKTRTNTLDVENNGCTTYDDIYFLKSIVINLNNYQPTCEYKVVIKYRRKFKGWRLNGSDVSGNVTLTSDATFEARWGSALPA